VDAIAGKPAPTGGDAVFCRSRLAGEGALSRAPDGWTPSLASQLLREATLFFVGAGLPAKRALSCALGWRALSLASQLLREATLFL
jgi:hypothetical protein